MKAIFQVLVVIILLVFNACTCTEKVVIKKEYVECKKPTILDLNYTNDTNYSIEPIEYEVVP